ncbi:hypothetical protein CMV_012632 [Castanea mollissima]|uniref:Uncharacterized protein n=1 Tax=Castanea mollissima TaxID=60419 RepID=A0A8J4REF8_9ROSI|nr:hypothetical protein CMV_012632 [Castanea mollissima]
MPIFFSILIDDEVIMWPEGMHTLLWSILLGDFSQPTQTSSTTSTFAHEQGQCPGFLCSPPTNALIWLWTDLPVCFFQLVLDAANTACGWMGASKNQTLPVDGYGLIKTL